MPCHHVPGNELAPFIEVPVRIRKRPGTLPRSSKPRNNPTTLPNVPSTLQCWPGKTARRNQSRHRHNGNIVARFRRRFVPMWISEKGRPVVGAHDIAFFISIYIDLAQVRLPCVPSVLREVQNVGVDYSLCSIISRKTDDTKHSGDMHPLLYSRIVFLGYWDPRAKYGQ